MKFINATLAALITTAILGSPASAEIFSDKQADLTQVKIVLGGNNANNSKPTAWGIDSNYIGPGDITRLRKIEIYLDDEKRLTAIKITRETYTGDIATLLFTDVKEFSIMRLKKGSRRAHQTVQITVRSTDSLSIP